MKKVNYLVALAALVAVTAFTACDQSKIDTLLLDDKENKVGLTPNQSHSAFKISKEDALKELINTLYLIHDNSDLRSTSNLRERVKQLEDMDVNNIISVQGPRLSLARSAEGSDMNEMMYLVNFEDEGGYAVLSADTRIPETVLAIVDNGSISASDFDTAGLFMTEEERQQEIENFKYFDEEEQDYYVGKMEEHRYPNHCLMEYAMDRIDDYDGHDTGYTPPSNYTRTGAWKMKEEVPALLDTKWHQDPPFNDMCPERKKYLLFGPKRKAYAGCVPVAVAQIMAYHEYPTHFTYNGIYVNWKEVKNVWNYDTSIESNNTQNLMAAALLKGIGDWTNILYGYSGSMGLPSKARKYLEFCGYRNVEKHSGKNTDKTMEMLRKHNPVFMAGAYKLRGGHTWVIDGFRIKTRDIETVDGSTGNVISAKTEEETLLHCNWGWGGTADGYYVAGTFNTKKGAAEYDDKDESESTGKRHYGWLFSIITYDK